MQFRWVGTLSEEELLGIPPSPRRSEVDATPFRCQEPPPKRPLHPAEAPRRRPHGRDALALLTVGAAVWLAVGGAGNGLTFSGSESDAPEALESTVSSVVVGHDPIASLPRSLPANGERTQPGGRGGAQASDTKDGKEGSAKDDDASSPPSDDGGGPGNPPLAEVDVPGVGQVTVEQPRLLTSLTAKTCFRRPFHCPKGVEAVGSVDRLRGRETDGLVGGPPEGKLAAS